MKTLSLKQGEVVFSREPVLIETVVSSCLAVIVWDKRSKAGGICHFFLPSGEPGVIAENNYGNYAVANLLRQFKESGSRPEDIVVKLVGGAQPPNDPSAMATGKANAETADKIISSFGLSVDKRSTGGDRAKALRFNSETGKLHVSTSASVRSAVAGKVKVLVIDDQQLMRKLLRSAIQTNPRYEVVGEARSPRDAIAAIQDLQPDVITLDLNLPRTDGIDFIRGYLGENPIPAIVVSGTGPQAGEGTMAALEAGAFHYIAKPRTIDEPQFLEMLHHTIGAAARFGARTSVRSYQRTGTDDVASSSGIMASKKVSLAGQKTSRCLLVVGASTGGTEAVRSIFRSFADGIPATVITVHIPSEFSNAFAERLNAECPFTVKEAVNHETIRPNTVYIAPGGLHTKVLKAGDKLTIKITDDPPVNRFKPSVDYLFNSVAPLNHAYVVGVLLTGMGVDGAKGMLSLKREGYPTIAQDEASSVVFGMPKAAIDLGAADQILDLAKIPRAIAKLLK